MHTQLKNELKQGVSYSCDVLEVTLDCVIFVAVFVFVRCTGWRLVPSLVMKPSRRLWRAKCRKTLKESSQRRSNFLRRANTKSLRQWVAYRGRSRSVFKWKNDSTPQDANWPCSERITKASRKWPRLSGARMPWSISKMLVWTWSCGDFKFPPSLTRNYAMQWHWLQWTTWAPISTSGTTKMAIYLMKMWGFGFPTWESKPAMRRWSSLVCTLAGSPGRSSIESWNASESSTRIWALRFWWGTYPRGWKTLSKKSDRGCKRSTWRSRSGLKWRNWPQKLKTSSGIWERKRWQERSLKSLPECAISEVKITMNIVISC